MATVNLGIDHIIFIDLETSIDSKRALATDRPPVIRLSAVALNVKSGLTVDEFDRHIKFKKEGADGNILEIIGYKDEDWVNACLPQDALFDFISWLEPYEDLTLISRNGNPYTVALLGGHNIRDFDIPILFQWVKAVSTVCNMNIFLPASYSPCIDTLEMFRTYQTLTGLWRLKGGLKEATAHFNVGINEEDHHNSLEDARAAMRLYLAILQLSEVA